MRGPRSIPALFATIVWIALAPCCAQQQRQADTPEPSADSAPHPDVELRDVPSDVDTDSAPIVLAVNFAGPTSETGRLIGWNIGRGTLYAPEGDPLHPEWRTPWMAEAVSRLSSIRPADGRPPLVRFSGLQIDGMLGGDGYHFWDFVRPDRTVAEDDNMATFEYHAIMDEIGGDGLVTLNFGSGTALEAAAYVRHLNSTDEGDAMAGARRYWGYENPWNHTTFEIGNEVFGWWNTAYSQTGRFSYANPRAENGGDPAWHRKPAEDPANYAARALKYIQAVLAVEPVARFWVPLSQASMDAWGGTSASIASLADLLTHPAVEAVVIHQYQVDDASVFGFWDKNSSELLLAGSDLFSPLYTRLRQELDALPRAEPLRVAVTEYHVAGAFSRFRFARGDQPVVGLGIADMLIAYANLGIDAACQHMALAFGEDGEDRDALVERWFNPFRVGTHGALVNMPSFEVTDMMAGAMLGRTVPVRTLRMTSRSYSFERTALEYTSVAATAFANAQGTRGTIVLLNRVQDSNTQVDVKIDRDARVTGAALYAPTSLESDATGEYRASDAVFVQVGTRVTLDLPPHSLTVLRVEFDAAH
ncbi:MAG: hypothetical protein IT350_18695 [Deltaproteobacteria bacterium]|nr:hypothetical protein [Deltaproteobacteria bacterium]